VRAAAIPLLAVLAALASGCGGDEDRYFLRTPPERVGARPIATPTPEPPPRPRAAAARDRRLVVAWADAVRRGDERRAARYFAIPALIDQGQTFRLTTRVQIQAFNEALPCGARVLAVGRDGRYVVATFRLVPRPGHECGTGTGERVRVAFLIRNGKFREFRQLPPEEATPTPTPTPTPRRVA